MTKAQTIGGFVIAAVLAMFALTGFAAGGPLFAKLASAGYGGQEKVQICHNGKTLTVASSAVAAHQAHGDTVGACV